MKKTIGITLKIFASLLIMAVALVIGFVLLIIIAVVSNNNTGFHAGMLFFIGCGILMLLLAWICSSRILAKVAPVIIVVAILGSGVKEFQTWRARRILKQHEAIAADINWRDYRPFVYNNKLVTLDEPSAETLAKPLPSINGAYALYPVYAAAVQAFYPYDLQGYYESVTTDGSDKIFKQLLDGKVDMIFALAPSTEQLADAEAKGMTYEMTALGRDAFVFYVNAQNPVSNLTGEQIRGIYSGKITNWKSVGAPRWAKIVPFQRNRNSGSQTTLERIMGDTPIMEPMNETKIGGMFEIIRDAATYRNSNEAIGFSFRVYATEMVRNDKIKLLSVDGIAPTPENIANGTYPFIATSYIITVKERAGNVQKFIDFMLSAQGREIVEKTGYVFYTECGSVNIQ